jgi:uncharacterized membrane protein
VIGEPQILHDDDDDVVVFVPTTTAATTSYLHVFFSHSTQYSSA